MTTSGPHKGGHRSTNESHILCYLQEEQQRIAVGTRKRAVHVYSPGSLQRGTRVPALQCGPLLLLLLLLLLRGKID